MRAKAVLVLCCRCAFLPNNDLSDIAWYTLLLEIRRKPASLSFPTPRARYPGPISRHSKGHKAGNRQAGNRCPLHVGAQQTTLGEPCSRSIECYWQGLRVPTSRISLQCDLLQRLAELAQQDRTPGRHCKPQEAGVPDRCLERRSLFRSAPCATIGDLCKRFDT